MYSRPWWMEPTGPVITTMQMLVVAASTILALTLVGRGALAQEASGSSQESDRYRANTYSFCDTSNGEETPELQVDLQLNERTRYEIVHIQDGGGETVVHEEERSFRFAEIVPWQSFEVGNRSVTTYLQFYYQDGTEERTDPVTTGYPCSDPDPEPGTGGSRETSESEIAGQTRVETASLLSKENFSSATTAVIATAYNYPDALAAGPLAAVERAPILLTDADELSQVARSELERLGVTRVIIVGGFSAVNQSVGDDLRASDIAVERIAGNDRYDTAALIAARVMMSGTSDVLYVASGQNFPDALALGQLAAHQQAPILLTSSTALPPATERVLRNGRATSVVVAGGTVAVAEGVEEQIESLTGVDALRIAGQTRYDTAAAILRFAEEVKGRVATSIAVATGENYPDALAAGSLYATADRALLLVNGTTESSSSSSLEEARRISRVAPTDESLDVTFIGGPGAISSEVRGAVSTAFASGG